MAGEDVADADADACEGDDGEAGADRLVGDDGGLGSGGGSLRVMV